MARVAQTLPRYGLATILRLTLRVIGSSLMSLSYAHVPTLLPYVLQQQLALTAFRSICPLPESGGHFYVLDTHKEKFFKNPTAKIDIALSTSKDVGLYTMLIIR